MRHAAMVDLAESPDDVAEGMMSTAVEMPKRAGPIYPYGCCIRLDAETCEKLGLGGDLPALGEMIHMCAIAQVRALPGESLGEDGKPRSDGCVELQITHMGVLGADPADEAAEASGARRSRFYGETDSDDDDD